MSVSSESEYSAEDSSGHDVTGAQEDSSSSEGRAFEGRRFGAGPVLQPRAPRRRDEPYPTMQFFVDKAVVQRQKARDDYLKLLTPLDDENLEKNLAKTPLPKTDWAYLERLGYERRQRDVNEENAWQQDRFTYQEESGKSAIHPLSRLMALREKTLGQ